MSGMGSLLKGAQDLVNKTANTAGTLADKGRKTVQKSAGKAANTIAGGFAEATASFVAGIQPIQRLPEGIRRATSSATMPIIQLLTEAESKDDLGLKLAAMKASLLSEIDANALEQQKLRWFTTQEYHSGKDADGNDFSYTYEQYSKNLRDDIDMMLDLLYPTEAESDPNSVRDKSLVAMANEILNAAEIFKATYSTEVTSAITDNDTFGRYKGNIKDFIDPITEKARQVYADKSNTIFIALMIAAYQIIFVTKGPAAAKDYATFLQAIADENAYTEMFNPLVKQIADYSKEHGVTASAAVLVLSANTAYNGNHWYAMLLLAIALALPAPGLINGERVKQTINKVLGRQIDTPTTVAINIYHRYVQVYDMAGSAKDLLKRVAKLKLRSTTSPTKKPAS